MNNESYEIGKFVMTERTASSLTLCNANKIHGTLREAEDGRLEFSGDVHESARALFESVVSVNSAEVARLKVDNNALREDLIIAKSSLNKYIKHVGQCEGTDFVSRIGYGSDVVFSEAEIATLNKSQREP